MSTDFLDSVQRCSKLGLAASLGVLLGTGIRCGEGSSPGVCISDSDCVLDCSTSGCCSPHCPCDNARSTAQAARIAEQRQDRCGDAKVECPPARPDACDWDVRYRAVCRVGVCVAEQIESGAAPEFQAPEIPPRFSAEDPRCRACERSREETCVGHVEWRCEDGYDCRMAPECDPACCEEVASTEVGLDAAPWATHITAAAATPATGVIVFASWNKVDYRLAFIEMPERRVETTDIALTHAPEFTWVDGTSDVLIATGDVIERVSFPSLARRHVLDGLGRVADFDVAPTGDVALVSFEGTRAAVGLTTVQLDVAEPTGVPVAWSAYGDSHARWSVDGRRIALAKAWRVGRVAVVDATTGQVEGRRTDARFVGPVWHPSGEFLLMWLQEDQDYGSAHCEMVVATPDRSRHARLGIVIQGRECPAIAVSPEGGHVASLAAQQLELFALGSTQAEPVAADGSTSVLEWVPLQFATLGVERLPTPKPPVPEPLEPAPSKPEPPKPAPAKPEPSPAKPAPEPEPPKPKPVPPKPKPPSSIEEVIFACAKQHPSSETSVTVRWWLAEKTGKVSKVEVLTSTTPEALTRCIESTARQLPPKPESAPSVTTQRTAIPPP